MSDAPRTEAPLAQAPLAQAPLADAPATDAVVSAAAATAAALTATPMLRIVRGLPDGTDPSLEIAVLTAVLSRRAGPAENVPAPGSAWAARDRLVRAPLTPGRDGWRTSALPH